MPRGRSASLVPRQGAPLSPRALRSTSPAEDAEAEDADEEAAAVTAADKAVDERIVSRLGRQRVALLLVSLDRADLALAELAESVAAAFETLADFVEAVPLLRRSLMDGRTAGIKKAVAAAVEARALPRSSAKRELGRLMSLASSRLWTHLAHVATVAYRSNKTAPEHIRALVYAKKPTRAKRGLAVAAGTSRTAAIKEAAAAKAQSEAADAAAAAAAAAAERLKGPAAAGAQKGSRPMRLVVGSGGGGGGGSGSGAPEPEAQARAGQAGQAGDHTHAILCPCHGYAQP